MTLDPRLNAIRENLVDRRLQSTVMSPQYSDGTPAVVNSGLVPVLKFPNEESEITTYYYYGETVIIFDRVGDYLWCQSTFDRYVGYVRQDSVDTEGRLNGGHFVCTMGSYAYKHPDLRSRDFVFLPRHARVHVVEKSIEVRGSHYVGLSDGRYILESCVSEHSPRSLDIADAASKYLGCPYLWAGKSFIGVDCSGLVQNCFRDLGEAVLRDTDMQRETIGTALVVEDIDALERDDLLFLPGHVLIYEGLGTVIHADGKTMTVHRESLSEFMRLRGLAMKSMNVRRRNREQPCAEHNLVQI